MITINTDNHKKNKTFYKKKQKRYLIQRYFTITIAINLKVPFLRESNRIPALQHATQITHFFNCVIIISEITILVN